MWIVEMYLKMKKIISQIILFLTFRTRPYQTEWVEDFPEKPRKKSIYIVGGREYPFEAKFFCPLGCGDILSVSIAPDHQKSWKVTEHENGALSISPSVWRTTECRCHFWIRKGRIVWCEDPPLRTALKKKWNRNKNKKLL